MSFKLLFAGLLSVALLPLANLQAQNTGSVQGSVGSANFNPAATSGMGAGANFDQTFNQQVGSMRFVGKVVIEGSKLPWDPIPIVVMCNGKMRFNPLADNKKGTFYIDASPRESEGVRSARDPKKVDPAEFVGCKVSAVLEGYESSTITIMNGSIMDNPDIGTITLHQDPRATGSIVSTTLASAPGEALKELEKAQADEMDNNLGSAKKHLQKAVSIDPQLAEAWYHLGKLEEKDKPQDALNALNKAAAADPKYIPPYEHIAAVSAGQAADPKFTSSDPKIPTAAAVKKKWQDVVDATDHALQLNPAGTPQVWYWNSVGNYNIGYRQLAETAALTALSMDPGHKAAPKAEDQLAVTLFAKRDFAGALEHLQKTLTYTNGKDADEIKFQIAQVEKQLNQKAK
jgi:tetratricopeptide (TPR) repeat protein